MLSATPKPLHRVGGAALLAHVMARAAPLGAQAQVLVVGAGDAGARVAQAAQVLSPDIVIVVQDPPCGTGDAARQGMIALAERADAAGGDLLVLYADTPFIRTETLARMRAARRAGAAVVVLGFDAAEPGGYGRLILSPDGGLVRIVEAADATPEERATRLCNAGVMMLDAGAAPGWLAALDTRNARGELYLTDVVAIARAQGLACAVARCAEAETLGVNDRVGLAAAEAAFQAEARASAMAQGVTLTAPDTVFFSHDTVLARDVVVAPNVVFGPGVVVGEGARIHAFSHLEGCTLAAGAEVGPFARLRPGARIAEGARVGNFVEVKNAELGPGARAGHLAYIGDAVIGAGVNIGAGAITCNFDGASKHRTTIGEGAFIGSNASLVAPVSIGRDAYVASGSVVTTDVPADALAIGRARQVSKPGLGARLRARLKRD